MYLFNFYTAIFILQWLYCNGYTAMVILQWLYSNGYTTKRVIQQWLYYKKGYIKKGYTLFFMYWILRVLGF